MSWPMRLLHTWRSPHVDRVGDRNHQSHIVAQDADYVKIGPDSADFLGLDAFDASYSLGGIHNQFIDLEHLDLSY